MKGQHTQFSTRSHLQAVAAECERCLLQLLEEVGWAEAPQVQHTQHTTHSSHSSTHNGCWPRQAAAHQAGCKQGSICKACAHKHVLRRTEHAEQQ